MLLQIVEVYNEERQIEYRLHQRWYSAREIARYFESWQNIVLIIRPMYVKTFAAKEANNL